MSRRYTPKKPVIINPKITQKRTLKPVEKLHVKKLNVRLISYNHNDDVLKTVEYLLSSQWDPIGMLKPDFQDHLMKFRAMIPGFILKYQLYSIHLNESSFIDQEVSRLIEIGELISLSNENSEIKGEILVSKLEYLKRLDQVMKNLNDGSNEVEILKKFEGFIKRNKFSVMKKTHLKTGGHFNDLELQVLVKLGFLKLIPLKLDSLSLSLPNFGFIMNIMTLSKRFILKQLNSTKYKESKLKDLKEKWNRYKLRYRDFKGLNVDWVLHYLIGIGTVEVFESTFENEKCVKLI